MSNFHYLARGLCVVDDHVLLAHFAGADNTFLPGGHIDFGEKTVDCLARELKEELGLDEIDVGCFLGAVEHKWEESDVLHCEINLLFQLRLSGIAPSTPPVSCEEHLEFIWAKPGKLAKHNLQPSPLIEYICSHIDDERAFWGSTL
jgi:8-oxo-dGTP pyrophosphatase MutT (NUDIX family)